MAPKVAASGAKKRKLTPPGVRWRLRLPAAPAKAASCMEGRSAARGAGGHNCSPQVDLNRCCCPLTAVAARGRQDCWQERAQGRPAEPGSREGRQAAQAPRHAGAAGELAAAVARRRRGAAHCNHNCFWPPVILLPPRSPSTFPAGDPQVPGWGRQQLHQVCHPEVHPSRRLLAAGARGAGLCVNHGRPLDGAGVDAC